MTPHSLCVVNERCPGRAGDIGIQPRLPQAVLSPLLVSLWPDFFSVTQGHFFQAPTRPQHLHWYTGCGVTCTTLGGVILTQTIKCTQLLELSSAQCVQPSATSSVPHPYTLHGSQRESERTEAQGSQTLEDMPQNK